jgi:hypothetical protein
VDQKTVPTGAGSQAKSCHGRWLKASPPSIEPNSRHKKTAKGRFFCVGQTGNLLST